MSFFSFKEIISVTLVLFSVIDILGSTPIIMDLRRKPGGIHPAKATAVATVIMVGFLFVGETILKLLSLDVASFAIAGALVLFLMGLEMVLDVEIFKNQSEESSSTIVPLAFPLIAGPGVITTIISLRVEFNKYNILFGIILNLIFVYIMLISSKWISNKLGSAGINVLRKIFGVVCLAIAIKLFKYNILA